MQFTDIYFTHLSFSAFSFIVDLVPWIKNSKIKVTNKLIQIKNQNKTLFLSYRSASPHLYTDTTKIKPESIGQGCPRCGGSVFKAEEVVEKGRTFHKKCFTCIKCNRPQDDKLQVRKDLHTYPIPPSTHMNHYWLTHLNNKVRILIKKILNNLKLTF